MRTPILYHFNPNEIEALIIKALTRFAATDGVYDFSENHTAQRDIVNDILAELDTIGIPDLDWQAEQEAMMLPESWLDEMIAEEERGHWSDETVNLMSRAELEGDNTSSEAIGLGPVA